MNPILIELFVGTKFPGETFSLNCNFFFAGEEKAEEFSDEDDCEEEEVQAFLL